MGVVRSFGAGALLSVFLSSGAAAVTCQGAAGFPAWLANFKREAVAEGISGRTLSQALDGVTYDSSVIGADRGQGVFTQSFFQFSDRMVAKYRIDQGRALIRKNAALFDRIEQRFGVPAPVIVAFWALETDFGKVMGDKSTVRSVATLAYDCRRPDMFRTQLIAALKILDRGDLTVQTMRGPWAGELGQFQFLPDHYLNYGVDFDGDGRVDLLNDDADALASAANYVLALGWKRGQPWLEEVRVPEGLPWEQADLSIKLPRSQWAQWGVRRPSGALPADGLTASLLLPMGRNGPAFLAYPNFDIYTQWNNSLVYATSAAYLATRIDGAGPFNRGQGKAIPVLSAAQMKQLQQLLNARGHHVGRIDGILGAATREAVRTEQQRVGLPADSWPTVELIARLKGG